MKKFKLNYNFYDLLKLYKVYAAARGFSPKTIRSTEVNLKMIGKILPLGTRIRKFNGKKYEDFLVKLRASDYSAETIYDLNATLRKLVNLGIKRELIKGNPLKNSGNITLKSNEKYRLISKAEFSEIKGYFKERGEIQYEFLFSLLYYSGMRIGEALALEFSDFREFSGRIFINKTYLYEFKLIKEPKNKKNRVIPLPEEVWTEFKRFYRQTEFREGRVFRFSPTAANEALRRVAKAKKIPEFHCHSFRHTYISILIREGVPLPVVSNVSGDTQKTILKRYSHMFEEDREIISKALKKIR